MSQLDDLDRKILDLLQHDARLTHKEIGEKVHKSRNAIYERVKRMEKDGVIRRYIAVLDPNHVNRMLMSFTHVSIKDHSLDVINKFEHDIIQFDEVMECYHMSGAYDFILKVAVKDMAAYHEFISKKLFMVCPTAHLESTFVMKEAKMELAFKLD
jgi:Lrp/AsnC family leucine-responsive transcriptional regulator